MLKDTHVFARHGGLDLECDVYAPPQRAESSPVLLFFHSGGLVGGSKECTPPWLVQACYRRKWPLISAAYRLLPQVGSAGLLEDVAAAYKFASDYGSSNGVIVGGASAGFFMATLTAHHNMTPPPLALLSITDIATFQHPFFSSSACYKPIPSQSDISPHLSGPAVAGRLPRGAPAVFTPDKLAASGAKNPAYTPPPPPAVGHRNRDELYEYYLYHNAFPAFVRDVDPGYGANSPAADWPPTVIFHGNADLAVSLDVSLHMQERLGRDRVKLFIAEGQGHLFEEENWWEDDTAGMAVVRDAIACLDTIVGAASE